MYETTKENIERLQGYLAEVSTFLSALKFRASENDAKIKIREDIENYLDGFTDKTQGGIIEEGERALSTDFAYFSEKEISTMPKNFRRLIILEENRCRMYKHKSGANSFTYEIKYRKNGYNISACGKTIKLAKENFLKKLKTAQPTNATNEFLTIPTTFDSFANFYFNRFRKEQVVENTFRSDMSRYKNYLQPYFKEVKVSKITPFACKQLLDRVRHSGKGKTADELFSILNCILKSAIAHGIILRNPLDLVLHVTHETESGTALTREEERVLKGSKSELLPVFMVALYTGARPNELQTVKIEGDFIVMVNSKRKNRKVKYKKVPIVAPLRPYIERGINVPEYEQIRLAFKEILPTHKLYDLRTTFHTRCIEYKVDEIARKLFMGHSLGELTEAYTDLPDDFLLTEGKKLDNWL